MWTISDRGLSLRCLSNLSTLETSEQLFDFPDEACPKCKAPFVYGYGKLPNHFGCLICSSSAVIVWSGSCVASALKSFSDSQRAWYLFSTEIKYLRLVVQDNEALDALSVAGNYIYIPQKLPCYLDPLQTCQPFRCRQAREGGEIGCPAIEVMYSCIYVARVSIRTAWVESVKSDASQMHQSRCQIQDVSSAPSTPLVLLESSAG